MDIQEIVAQGMQILNETMRDTMERVQHAARQSTFYTMSYATRTEYGFPPAPPSGTIVEGSIVHPIVDESRLIGESNKDA